MYKKYMLYVIIIFIIVLIMMPYINDFLKPKYEVNHCIEAYSCKKYKDNLYNCVYCAKIDENNKCIKEKEIRCEYNE